MAKADQLRNESLKLINDYYEEVHVKKISSPGASHVPVSGKGFDAKEMQYVLDSALDGWFTTGRFNDVLEKRMEMSRSLLNLTTE